ncbi:hypothetical protein C8A00DRAFT_36479 [Chaetomidium leptoderma]|uniref:6-phosphogluconate dehydrogenase NADP-binding domain-containing protein n=1 Tax=Chaetomidium leptoderma TaxID=669021 RepID=A0AAN6VG79_9PEZI|nr:hypothetical protein C8A00DRAFT_36479 [Chaetomidium leptoderma]
MATVTSIGIGNMGAALASTLLKSSTPPTLTIWNRTADRPQAQSLTKQGAAFEPSLAAAVARSTTLLICLIDYHTIYVALAAAGLFSKDGTTTTTTTNPQQLPFANKTIINLTNGSPRQARQMEEDGETEALYRNGGGGVAALLLKPIGAVQYVAEDAGAASLYDVAALAGMYGMFIGAFTGMALLKKQWQQGKQREQGKQQGGVAAVAKYLSK